MRVIGLTGGIGSGKSTVGRLLRDAGAFVIDADQVARDVVRRGTPGLAAIADAFGPDVIGPDGELDRPAMAGIVFNDPERRKELESITHPRIGTAIQERMAGIQALELGGGRERLVVVEHPLLVETGLAAGYEVVIVVLADEDVRLTRLVERGLSRGDARARMAAQATDDQRRAAATHIVDNSGDLASLGRQVAVIARDLLPGPMSR